MLSCLALPLLVFLYRDDILWCDSHAEKEIIMCDCGLLSKIYGFYAKFRAYYCTVPPQTIYFRCDRKQNKERSASIPCTFESSAIKLQQPWVLPATSLLECQNAIVINFWIACTHVFGHDRMLNGQHFTYIRIALALTTYMRNPFHPAPIIET